jgi:murein DD-endopeptidase MepM/ murein hydrolase activator NlpD
MDSIIASQKIGKRRRASELRAARSAATVKVSVTPYKPILETKGQGHSQLEKVARRSRAKRSPRPFAFRWRSRPSRPSRLRSELSLLVLRLGSKLSLRKGLPSVSKKLSALPKPRLALYSLISVAAAIALGLGAAAIARGPSFPMPQAALLPADDSSQDLLLDYVSPELASGAADADQDSPLPPAPVTMEMGSYTVRSGDSLASIAKRFGLNMDTIISANGIADARAIKSGRELRIPNIDGLVYKTRKGDNLAAIAKRYKTDTTKIVDANDLGSSRLTIGQSIFIPGARLPQAEIAQALGQRVTWPARGPLSSYFGYRPDPFTGVRRFHGGIDIVVDTGTQIRAAMSGRVADAGYNGNYGNYVILSHADGFQTLYGHLTSYSVVKGQQVAQGAVIGLSGNTGYSTGPHLHFGLYKRSLALNPLKYLK